uniref:Uncharacterized protein n=1 Tax=Arundo donax TaxID=35708 RepID=A0A0A9AL95_ARUDO
MTNTRITRKMLVTPTTNKRSPILSILHAITILLSAADFKEHSASLMMLIALLICAVKHQTSYRVSWSTSLAFKSGALSLVEQPSSTPISTK